MARLLIGHLRKAYGQQTVLAGASMIFEEGRIYSILGRKRRGEKPRCSTASMAICL